MGKNVDPDQMASSEASCSGSTVFFKKKINTGSAGQRLILCPSVACWVTNVWPPLALHVWALAWAFQSLLSRPQSTYMSIRHTVRKKFRNIVWGITV